MMETQELVVPKSIPITGPLTLELYDLITIVDRVAFYSMNQKKRNLIKAGVGKATKWWITAWRGSESNQVKLKSREGR